MSNNSWKQYGGISRMEEFNVINANTVVAEQFVSRSTRPIYQYLNGTFEVSGDLSAANNIITSTNFYCKSDITVDRVLVRPSGTENKIRVMVEAPDEKTATKYATDISKLIKSKT